MQANWQPTCDLSTWRARQQLMGRVREFFTQRNLLEVETPVLSQACGTDPHLDYFATQCFVDSPSARSDARPRYLMTSPEFHMKRLLAAGFGDCWQIARAFRNGESGPRHNCEFTLVEWYRVGWTMDALMEEVIALASAVLGRPLHAQRLTWQNAFLEIAGIEPFHSPAHLWQECCARHGIPLPADYADWTREDWWDYGMVCIIEPALRSREAVLLVHYPASQAALAQLWTDAQGRQWANRFELYLNGVELCNGYQELLDRNEQAQRFEQDLHERTRLGKRSPAPDFHFLDALESGLPACSGVALGLDRLFMLALGKQTLPEVLLFPDVNA